MLISSRLFANQIRHRKNRPRNHHSPDHFLPPKPTQIQFQAQTHVCSKPLFKKCRL
uniref:Uncharacterized protein n=1 Tax=Helianthus annuus TaxID=4232 RepID=A0A251UZP3_HELAN